MTDSGICLLNRNLQKGKKEMSLFSEENRRLRLILLGIAAAGCLLFLAGVPYGVGFLSGTALSVILYERNVRYWNRIADRGHARTGTGILHFMLHYALMAGIMMLGVYHRDVINIFTSALGLTAVKAALIIDALSGRKESI